MVTTPVTEAADMLAPLIALAGAVASAGDRLVCPAGTALGELRAVADAMVAKFLMSVSVSSPNVAAYCYRLGLDYGHLTMQTDCGPRCADGRLKKNQNGPGPDLGRRC